jgi:hypothetical protein
MYKGYDAAELRRLANVLKGTAMVKAVVKELEGRK